MSFRIAPGDLAGLGALRPGAIGVFCCSNVRPLRGVAGFIDWRVCGVLSRTLERDLFAASLNEVMLLPVDGRLGRCRLFVFGLGQRTQCSQTVLRRVGRKAVEVMRDAGVSQIVLAAPSAPAGALERSFVRALRREVPDQVDIVLVEDREDPE